MKPDKDGVLERNVSTLIETGGEPPRISDAARARIRAHLVDKHGAAEPARTRSPWIAVGLGVAATAVAALIATRIVGTDDAPAPRAKDGELADGSTWIVEPGSKVHVIGPRRVRVEGNALLDVVPGKGTFIVETARGQIEVLGTRFLVSAAPNRTTTAVVRGQVKLATSDGSVLVHAGEQAVAEPGRPPVRGPAPRLSHLVSWAAQARKQDTTIKPLRNGSLFAHDPNNPRVPESPLPITKLTVDVVVEDQVARVALDQTFYNPAPTVMEGMYRFTVPPDASLQRLAMYVGDTLMESAVVERMQARRIYEDIVYRRLDPALLEWAGTGRVSLRVYPLFARAEKRLLLAYTQSLSKLYDDWTLQVPLPEVDVPVGELGFDVRLRGCANCEVTSTSHAIQVKPDGDDAIVTYRQQRVELGDSLVLRVRDSRRAPVVTAHRDATGTYMMVRARPDLAQTPRAYRPRTWVIANDVSASRGPVELRAQTELVDAFLEELDEDDRVAIVAFDVSARTLLAPTRVDDVDRNAVQTALAREGGVGATSFEAGLAEATKLLDGVAPDDAMILYLGDGVVTTDAKHLDALRGKIAGKARFVGVGVGDGPDTQTLDTLAAATGGYATAIDLADDLRWRAFDLVAALHTPRVTGLYAKLVGANGALVPATTYIKSAQAAHGEELELVAKLASDATPVAAVLTGTLDGTPWEQRIALEGAAPIAAYLPRLWAQRHINARMLAKHEPVVIPPCVATDKAPCPSEAELREQRDETIRKEVVALGMKYFLMSRHTSLLVLENDAMYAQYKVTKGSGDTWAPYKVPAKLPPTPAANKLAGVADDAELVRTPLPVFYEYGSSGRYATIGAGMGDELRGGIGSGRHTIRLEQTRATLGLRAGAGSQPVGRAPTAPPPPVASTTQREFDKQQISTVELQNGLLDLRAIDGELAGAGWDSTGTVLGKKKQRGPHMAYPQRYTYPTDAAFDDLTQLVPALFPDASDALRAELGPAAAKAFPIDDGAKSLLAAARKSLRSGVYRWGAHEIAVDDRRRFAWRTTTDRGLRETASFDGTTWTRRYAELGLDVTREYADHDIALALANFPLWIAEPAHYARFFEVRLTEPREITLSRPATNGGRATAAYVLTFDDKHRLQTIADGDGSVLLAITWGADGPTSARLDDTRIDVGFSPQPMVDASAWAHGGAAAGVNVALPAHLPAYWTARLDELERGTPEWRHAQRQAMVAAAATNDHAALIAALDLLRAHGGIELGDVVLASAGIVRAATDAQATAALAQLRDHAVARYLQASRAYIKANAPERLTATMSTGAIGALWTLREGTALVTAGKYTRAVDRLLAIDPAAPLFRRLGAFLVNQRYDAPATDVVRMWDAVAVGDFTNAARAYAAQALANRNDADGAADRVAALVANLDLDAAPPSLASLQYQVQRSRRGQAGWQLVWAMWRDRVLAGTSYAHVLALMEVTHQYPLDMPKILARAATLANGDTDRIVALAHVAIAHGQAAWAQTVLEPLVKTRPTRELHQLLGTIALQQGRTAAALERFEAAQDAGADEAVSIAVVRAELGQIVALARQLAVQSSGLARDAAVAKAATWATRWRGIDPGNAQIDQLMGELYLAVGNVQEAWRQLSTVIERDPLSGDGYALVAQAFEQQGRVAEAIDYWHQALVIDQTNPTHRLRKAQALIAVGRAQEGDAILEDIAGRTWHVRWDNVVYQAKSLLQKR